MADCQAITILLCLPPCEAAALAHLAGRLGPEDCARYAAPCRTYDGKPEADAMHGAVLTLSGALMSAGYAPR